MTKPKPTPSDHLRFIAIMQNLMDSHEGHGGLQHESEGVKTLFDKAYQRYNKQADAVLQPKPKRTRKPQARVQVAVETDWIGAAPQAVKATFEPTEYENRMPKTGRQKS